MAGYLFGLDSQGSLDEAINAGLFSTRMSIPMEAQWQMHHEGTFADYTSMKAGDNVYFFIDRKIYGVGELVNIENDCKSLNFAEANHPYLFYGFTNNRFIYLFPKHAYDRLTPKNKLGLSYSDYIQQYRFVCYFKPFPLFFAEGVDMDDMLTSEPAAFKILRDFYQKSFIKIDNDENQAFKNLILRRNSSAEAPIKASNYLVSHNKVLQKLISDNYSLTLNPLLNNIIEGDSIKHEMAIEAAIIHQLSQGDMASIEIFGSWEYLSHQVPASPAKPNNYLDRVDIFGYSYIEGLEPTKSQFLIAEIKKDNGTVETLYQLMKYVDFIKSEYAYSDYSMITAFLVAYDFDDDCIELLNEIVTRNYIHGIRPSITRVWNKVKLIKYRYDSLNEKISFEIKADATLA